KFSRFLAQTELVDLPPQKVLEIGMAQLKVEQQAFADAAKKIDPNKSSIEVFKQIQSEHPAPDKLISDVAKDLDKIRKYVLNRHVVNIPSEVRAKVKETPQYLRATSLASMDTPGPFEKRATDPHYYLTPQRRGCQTSCQISHGSGRRSAASSLLVMRIEQDAHPEHVGRRGHQIFPGQLLLRGKTSAPGSDARHIRSRLLELHAREIGDPEITR